VCHHLFVNYKLINRVIVVIWLTIDAIQARHIKTRFGLELTARQQEKIKIWKKSSVLSIVEFILLSNVIKKHTLTYKNDSLCALFHSLGGGRRTMLQATRVYFVFVSRRMRRSTKNNLKQQIYIKRTRC